MAHEHALNGPRPGLIIAGSSGYIGHSLARVCRSMVPTLCVARTRARIDPYTDFVSFASLAGSSLPAGVDPERSAIVHVAGCSREYADAAMLDGNIRTTESLISAARRWGVRRIVFVSGYGIPNDSQSVFFRAKRAAERLIEESGISHAIVRCSYILGEDDELIPSLRQTAAQGVIRIPGDGHYRLNPTSLYDLLAVLFSLALTNRELAGRHDFAGEPVSYSSLVEDIAMRLGPGIHIEREPIESYIRSAMLDRAPAMSLTQVGILLSDIYSDHPMPLAGVSPIGYRRLLDTLDYRGDGPRLDTEEWRACYKFKEAA